MPDTQSRVSAVSRIDGKVMTYESAIFPMVSLILAAAPSAWGEPAPERGQGQCFSVKIQNERVNEAAIPQDCNMNFSRTVQAGKSNWAETVQTGEVNNSKVRQYQYEHLRHPEQRGGD